MPNIYTYLNEDGSTDTIQIDAAETKQEATRGRIVNKEAIIHAAKITFEQALATIKPVAKGLRNVIDEANPDEASIEFSLKAGGEAGFFSICRAATEAEFKITLTWKNEKQKQTS